MSTRRRNDLSERKAVKASVCVCFICVSFLCGSSRRADLPVKLLRDAPLSLRTFSSVLLILPFLLWESRRFCHSLPLTAEWWRSELLTLAVKRFKNGNLSGRRRADDGGVEGWRPRPLLHFSPSFWFFYPLSSVTCSPSLQPVLLKVQDTFLLLPFSPFCPKKLFWTTWRLFCDSHVYELNQFLGSIEEPWEGIGSCPDTFGMTFLWF